MPTDKAFSSFAGKNILVTGASGFIGTHLCRRLIELGASVHGLSRKVQSPSPDMRWWQADLVDRETLSAQFRAITPDYVYHLASFVSGDRSQKAVMPSFRSNLESSLNLLDLATELGCERMVMTGSLEEHQPNPNEILPASPYAAAKIAASAYARMYHKLYQTPVALARLFMVYGPDQKDRTKLIPHVILSLLQGKASRHSSGTREVDWIYVHDVVNGLLTMGLNQQSEGQTLDLGTGKMHSVKDVVSKLYELVGTQLKPIFDISADRPQEVVVAADLAHTRRYIDWEPATVLSKGLSATLEWYR